MKKGFQITILTTLLTFLLMGTAIAHPLSENMMQWYKPASIMVNHYPYATDTRSTINFKDFSQNQTSNLWEHAQRFTRIQQILVIAGYRANLTVTIQSMLQSVRAASLAPAITLEFVW
jgi:hypothetical protein